MTPMRQAADRALTRPRRRGLAAAASVVVLAAVGYVSLIAIRPPAARSANVPAAGFSAARAVLHVQAIAARPHVAGSAANDQVREYLLTTLRGIGLSPEVQDTVSVQGGELSASAGGIGMARVRNVVTRIPGTASTGRIFLVAHYDSVQTGPGGNDDAAGVSSILEIARALTSGPRLRNDVVLVLTDAEEACLCGAKAFIDQDPLATGGGVVLNLEARGSSGPAVMFETSRDNAKLVSRYGRAPKPVGTSFAVEIYRLMPNDTDFTAFRDAGFAGLNSAYIDGAAVYHAPTDRPSVLDSDSVQHHGDNALVLVRDLGGRDLSRLKAAGDATYFPVPGGQLTYPGYLVWPLAALALLAVLVLAWLARRRGLASGGRLAGGFLLTLIPIVLAPILAQAFWIVMQVIRPGYREMLIDPYRPLWYRLAVVALTAAVIFGWYALFRRRVGPAALAIGALGWLAVLGVALAALAPGGSYLTALPALAGAVAGIVAILLRGGWASVVAVLVGAAAAVVVLLPTVVLFFPALGLHLAATGGFVTVLLGLALLPIVDLVHPEAGGQRGLDAVRARRRGGLPLLVAAVAVIAFAATGLRVDRFDAAHPAPTHLMYALDTDTGQARWLSAETSPQEWTGQYVSGSPRTVTDTLPAFGPDKLLSGRATAAPLPAPQVTVVTDTTSGDTRTLSLRLVPQRPVRLVALHVGAGATVTAATVGGRPVPIGKTAGGPWGFGFVFNAPPASGVDVILRVRGTAPVKLRAMDASDGLTALPGFKPRPADVGIAGTHTSEMVAVARTYSF
ncbi:MAG TPA: M28 family peptidase [Actinoplanes sp.]|nr:M28 family peptidase [Actinoplanes sp.]